MKTAAVAIIAFNEEQNIEALIHTILKESLPIKLLIYTDGSTDSTASIVKRYRQKYPFRIRHIQSKKRLGKNHAFNVILPQLRQYKTAIFLDADINFTKGSLVILYQFLKNHKDFVAVSPLLLPHTAGLTNFENTIADLYAKSRIHAFSFGRTKYISARCYCIRTSALIPIPKQSIFDDFYLNLNIPYEKIAVCMDTEVYYRRPSTVQDLIRYNMRLGKALASIHRHYPKLWTEQLKRVSLIDYAVFDLTRYGFNSFFSKLTVREKIVFITTRAIATISMFCGFYTYRSSSSTWKPIQSTKISYQ